VALSVPLLSEDLSNLSRPGSWMGAFPPLTASTLSRSTSIPMTLKPLEARQEATVRPT
jgi:hypothetical protein